MTDFFQPLDLTVNRAAKQHTRKSFVTYYSDCVSKQLEAGRNLDDIEVDLRLIDYNKALACTVVGGHEQLL